LAGHDDELLRTYVEDGGQLTPALLRKELIAQTGHALVHPVFFGSAVTGAGVDALMAGLVELLPSAPADSGGPLAATVFKIERGVSGEKVAYVRVFSGSIRTRDRLDFGRDRPEKATAVSVFERGAWVRRNWVGAGAIGKLWGLAAVGVGDTLGRGPSTARQFAPPTLETVVAPRNPADGSALRVALGQLAEQDPLINVRQDDLRHEIAVSLYGEVQKEVIQSLLANDYGIAVEFRETTTICVERPLGMGEAVEVLNAPDNPFRATVGLRVEPAPPGTGVEFRLAVHPRTVPLYVYKNVENYAVAIQQYVQHTLREGLSGWAVTDCVVTMMKSNYSSPDGPPSTRGPLSTAADFKRLTPLVLMRALEQARTRVCEPVVRATLEVPTGTAGGVLATLARMGVAVEGQVNAGDMATMVAVLPAVAAHDLQRRLPGLTGGEGVLESTFEGYRPVRGEPPTQRRLMPNPLNREEYLLSLSGLGAQLLARD
jgi:ribosomal protection tetracycline resistance protein